MTKGMCITYEVEGALYINITNRCSNRCSFCIRNNGDGAYGSDSLWLEHEPSVEEILASVFECNLDKYSEVVFCGYGEPTYRLHDAIQVARAIKAKKDIKIRINTNGQSDLILGENTAKYYCGAFDKVSISLNASNSEKYQQICHPVYKNLAFSAIIEFAKNVKKCVPEVAFSVVRQSLTEKEIAECQKIADEASVPLRIREYIKAEDD
jgi:TatD family-associated radical SAM protein